MARRAAAPAYAPAYSPMATNAQYQTLNLDIDSTDPYGLGSPTRQVASPPPHRHYSARSPSPRGYDAVSPPPHRAYAARSPSPTPRRYGSPVRSHTPYGEPSGYTEAAEDLAAVYAAAPRYDTPAPPTFAYDDEKTEYDDEAPPPVHHLSNLARRGTGAKASRATSHSGQNYDSDEEGEAGTPYEALGNIHVGPAPEQVTRRNQTTKRVVLTNGNIVLDCPVPTRLRGFLPRKDHEEFVFMRYSAVTCDPDAFEKCQFTLRPAMYGRDTELLIGITMFNEDEVLFCRTLHHVMKNISHLCSRVKSQTWGTDGWKKIVVCIISDGRKNISPRVLDTLAALGVYQDGVAKNAVRQDGEEKTVEAHLYEFTTQLSVDPKLQFKGLEKGIVPTQILFCLKEKNAKKLNSHRWLFNAFASMLSPNIVILLDVGTKPGPKSLYHLWKTFDLNSNVGGACGEICAMKGTLGLSLLNPLVGAQNFEYKMSNILDKPTESLFGYISVLPGAFSAYRYVALQNDNLKRGPLASYFKGETLAGYEADVYTSNMYLAEDRILCWELVAKRGSHWVLKYVPAAVGETDVPDTLAEWISQRRRWLNGSFFAAIYSLTHVFQIFGTDHSLSRKTALFVESFYNFLQLAFAWFGMGNYYIFFTVLTSGLEDPAFKLDHIHIANVIMQYLYSGTLIACFVFSLGNRPQGSKWKYTLLVASFALLTTYMMAAALFCVVRAIQDGADTAIFIQLVISLLATYGCYVAASLIALDPWHLVTSMPQYLLLAPVFVNLLNTYSFCNLHDFSWGTKTLDKAGTDLGVVIVGEKNAVDIVLPTAQADIDLAYDDALHNLKTRPKIIPAQKTAAQRETDKQDYYRNVRTNVVLLWVMTNGILAATITSGDLASSFASGEGSMKVKIYMVVILSFIAFMSAFRFLASTAYRCVTLFTG